MFKYGQYCPVAQALEILGDRWTLLIVRDLLSGTRHFNHLARGLPGISRGLLASRLQRLQDTGLLEKEESAGGRTATTYVLTEAGLALRPVIGALMVWGANWSFGEPDPKALDPLLLMWWMHDRVHTDRLPADRIVIEFNFRTASRDLYWLVVKPGDVSLCVQHPGFDVDVFVEADLAIYYKVWMGWLDYEAAVGAGLIRLDALPAYRRDFPSWFAWSIAAPTIRSVRDARASAPNET
ncbi:MAG: helix-turn-helix domain-containing protein [Rhodothermales bacterium]